eukprot:11244258-Alexandrium_andersonii.AAC.1
MGKLDPRLEHPPRLPVPRQPPVHLARIPWSVLLGLVSVANDLAASPRSLMPNDDALIIARHIGLTIPQTA